MKPLAWAAVVVILFDTMLSTSLRLDIVPAYEARHLETAALLIKAAVLGGFLIYFASRLRAGARTLRFFLLLSAALLFVDFMISVMWMLGVFVWSADAWLLVTLRVLYLINAFVYIALGIGSLLLAIASNGLTRIIGIIVSIVSLVAWCSVTAFNVLGLLDALELTVPESLSEPIFGVLGITSWSVQIFWLSLAGMIASIAVKVAMPGINDLLQPHAQNHSASSSPSPAQSSAVAPSYAAPADTEGFFAFVLGALNAIVGVMFFVIWVGVAIPLVGAVSTMSSNFAPIFIILAIAVGLLIAVCSTGFAVLLLDIRKQLIGIRKSMSSR